MPISHDCIDFLFDILKFYDEQYNKIVDSCFDDVSRASNEICDDYLKQQRVKIQPTGAYALKNNYQVLEPMEFLCVLPADREVAYTRELEQKKKIKKKKNTIKNIYSNILGNSSNIDMSAFDVAEILMRELQKYIGEDDKVYFKNNVVFLKFHINEQTEILVVIYVVYDFDKNGIYEYSRLGYKTKENTAKLIKNLQRKNLETDGNFLLMSKLVKMLELELVIAEQTDIYLSKKTFFVENILYNVPNKFYKGKEFSEIFINITNYLKQCDAEDIKIPDGSNQQMFLNYGYYANSNYNSFVKKLTYLCKNTDELIMDALAVSENLNAEKPDNFNTMQNKEEDNNTIETKEVKKFNKNIDKK